MIESRVDDASVEVVPGVHLARSSVTASDTVLSPEAIGFVADLQRRFGGRREAILDARICRQAELDGGAVPDWPADTAEIRAAEWTIAPTPPDLLDRRVEITGPAEPKMMINAMNSGARVFMADLEDSLSPTWANVVGGHLAISRAVRRELTFDGPDGTPYRLGERLATLVVRPRGWHLVERHMVVDGRPVSASLFDLGLFLYHSAQESLRRGSGPYLYLPKLEGRAEATLWNDVFVHAQASIGIPNGSIRSTVLIETVLAAFEMDEILYELRDHVAGLNAGRWDYLFSCIKKFRDPRFPVFPERGRLTMTVPFMRAYTERLVQTCHRRDAHAIGGMAAFIPSRRDAEVNATAMSRVREDKERESRDGFDGTWVAHPDLVPLATEVFDAVLGSAPHQKDRQRDAVNVGAGQLRDLLVPGAVVTETGYRTNVSVAIRYLHAWLAGRGAVAIDNLMEDAATAEICRSQLWQWRTAGARLDDGRVMSVDLYLEVRDQEIERLRATPDALVDPTRAADLLDRLVLADDFIEFLTTPAYELLD